MENLTTVLVSAAVGAAVAALGAIIQNILSVRAKIDESLRTARLDVYKVLWKKTEVLPKWPESDDVTYQRLHELCTEFRDWYFGEGGIYLSGAGRNAYGDVQEKLARLTDDHRKQGTLGATISKKDYNKVQKLCHQMRNELTRDILSRKRAFLIGR